MSVDVSAEACAQACVPPRWARPRGLQREGTARLTGAAPACALSLSPQYKRTALNASPDASMTTSSSPGPPLPGWWGRARGRGGMLVRARRERERGNFSLSLVFSRTLLCTRSFGAGRRERERAFPFPRAPLAHAHTHAHTHTHAHSTPGPWQGSALTSLTPAHQPWSPPRAGRGPRARPRWRRLRPSTCRTSAPWAVAPPRQPGRLPPPRPTGRPPWTRSSRAWSSSSAWGGSGGWGEKDTHRAGARALNPPRRPLPFT